MWNHICRQVWYYWNHRLTLSCKFLIEHVVLCYKCSNFCTQELYKWCIQVYQLVITHFLKINKKKVMMKRYYQRHYWMNRKRVEIIIIRHVNLVGSYMDLPWPPRAEKGLRVDSDTLRYLKKIEPLCPSRKCGPNLGEAKIQNGRRRPSWIY